MWGVALLCLMVLIPRLHCALQLDDSVARAGKAELQRLRGYAAQPRYGECWSRTLERIQKSCQELTEDTQSRIALGFTHCHLRRSGRPFPVCTDDSEVRECTQDMDSIAFNTYTEFFTHAHSICHYLQSERWQHRTEDTIHRSVWLPGANEVCPCRLRESSAGVAEQLTSTQRMAEDLVEAQSAALKTQEAILRNGEQLKITLLDSTQGVKDVFSELQDSAREQKLAFSEIFSRVAFLQSFIMSESHTLSSLLYNTLGLCAAFLLTLVLFALVAVNVYVERMICRTVQDSTDPGYLQMERIDLLVGLLRRAMVLLGLLVLVFFAVRFRDVRLESLEILAQLKETQSNLHLALQRAENLTEAVDGVQAIKGRMERMSTERSRRRRRENGAADTVVQELSVILAPSFSSSTLSATEEPPLSDSQEICLYDSAAAEAQSTMETPRKRGRRRSSGYRHSPSAFVYSVLVDDKQPRYNLRNRRSLCGSVVD
ncbi:hypothetical protein JZ751_003293 [Albula glossodonta]|uniref:Protein brambleberry n=1 Tax=Albula glossodonta TaxID=121402 RepID=A0A8T2N7U8_9TELE|nr:hypothetical protein JZ751_003293 [Albula glossodonta]